MDYSSIKTRLESFVERYDSQTYIGSYRETGRSSLLNDGLSTRANSLWKMAEYVVAKYDGTDTPLSKYINGWIQLAAGAANQYLLLEENSSSWGMYDSQGNRLGGEDYITEHFNQQEKKKHRVSGDWDRLKCTISRKSEDCSTSRYLAAIRTKPFLLLAGISGTGKSRVVRKLAQMTVTEELQKKYDKEYSGIDFENDRWNLHTPANFKLIQVKPNWHNSMDVVGYLTNIPKPHYVFTPFVEFIARAWQHQDIPFFLCLDEMNLAPVEEYFAEFLSAIESRASENHNGEEIYITDPIIKPFVEFDTENVKLSEGMINTLLPKIEPASGEEGSKVLNISEHFKHKGLTLPKNLIVIGTVNMDETTYSFSRKVLDRAMSFEMNDVDYIKFLEGKTDDELKAICEELKDNLNELLTDRHIEAKEIVSQLGEDAEFVVSYLNKVNNLLAGTPFKLGYRAANEAMLYVMAARETRLGDVLTAMNDFTLMKILSRFEGDFAKMRIDPKDKRLKELGYSPDEVKDKRPESADSDTITILSCMHKIIEDMLLPATTTTPETDDEEASLFAGEDETKVEATKQENKQLTSLIKLENMMDQLNRERFVSYWN